MQLTTSALLALAALLPHALGASLHHQHAREHAALAHAHAERAPAAAAPAPIRRRKTCTRRSSSLSATATSTATSSSASATATATATSSSDSATESESASDSDSASSAPTSSSEAAPKPTSTSTPTSSAAPKPSPTSSSAAPTHTSSGGNTPFTPNGNKAGIAGLDSFPFVKNHIGWFYDWTPTPAASGGSGVPVSMLWGGGTSGDSADAGRLQKFKSLAGGAYKYVLGFEEPDCAAGGGSAGMSVQQGAQVWNNYVASKRVDGTLLGSPSMCHQAAETWLTPFEALISTPWDFTNIHINKNNMDGVKNDIDYYANKYNRPIWVSEFACVDDSTGFVPCTDQGEIDGFISDIVDLFEADGRIAAYAYSDGEGLGSVWPSVKNGALSASGTAYLNAISKYH